MKAGVSEWQRAVAIDTLVVGGRVARDRPHGRTSRTMRRQSGRLKRRRRAADQRRGPMRPQPPRRRLHPDLRLAFCDDRSALLSHHAGRGEGPVGGTSASRARSASRGGRRDLRQRRGRTGRVSYIVAVHVHARLGTPRGAPSRGCAVQAAVSAKSRPVASVTASSREAGILDGSRYSAPGCVQVSAATN
jgi:hypothetical protein